MSTVASAPEVQSFVAKEEQYDAPQIVASQASMATMHSTVSGM